MLMSPTSRPIERLAMRPHPIRGSLGPFLPRAKKPRIRKGFIWWECSGYGIGTGLGISPRSAYACWHQMNSDHD